MPSSSSSITPTSLAKLEKLTIPQLKAVAKRNMVEFKSTLTKKQLVRALSQHLGFSAHTPSYFKNLSKASRPKGFSPKKVHQFIKPKSRSRSRSRSRSSSRSSRRSRSGSSSLKSDAQLEKMTIPQLRAYAKKNGYDLKSDLTKKEIVRTIGQLLGTKTYTPTVINRLGKASRPKISKKKAAQVMKELGFK